MKRRDFLFGFAATMSTWPAANGKDLRAARNFKLPDLAGRQFQLTDWKDKVVLLDLWATWCETCIVDIPLLNKLQEKYEDRGLQVIGVAVQSGWAADIKPHVAKLEIKYPILVGNDDIMNAYRIIGVPTTFLIGKDGKIHKSYVGTPPGKDAEKAADLERQIEALLGHQ